MSGSAKISSVDALRALRVSLCKFAEVAAGALEEAEGEIDRTAQWLKQEQQPYYKTQTRKCSEQLARAKLELKSKQEYMKSPVGGQYSFVDEKKAVAVAQRRLEEAQQKFEAGKRWIPQIERESYNFKGMVQGLAGALELEIPNARARIDGMIESLQAYFDTAPASALTAGEKTQPAGDMRRPEPDEIEDPDPATPTDRQEDENER
jgi:hypothetical protein